MGVPSLSVTLLALVLGRKGAERLISVACCATWPSRWRVFWLTMTNRATPDAPAESVLTETEIEILDQVAERTPAAKRTVSHYLMLIAKLGGYLARTKDPPPGNMVLWRGLTRLTDIQLGYELHRQLVGN